MSLAKEKLFYWLAAHRQRLILYLATLIVITGGTTVLLLTRTPQALKQTQTQTLIEKDQLKNQLLARHQSLTERVAQLRDKKLLVGDLEVLLEDAKTLIEQNRLGEAQKKLDQVEAELLKWENAPAPAETTTTSVETALTVTVNDGSSPLDQVEISLYQAKKIIAQSKSSSDGRAKIQAAPGTYQLLAKKSGYSNLWKNITLTAGAPLEITLTLKKTSSGVNGQKGGGTSGGNNSGNTTNPAPTPTPSPTQPPPSSGLTKDGIFYWTNVSRTNNNVAALKSNALLDKAAANKVADFFACNYFAHDRPASDLCPAKPWYQFITEVGYRYQKAGENIAFVCCSYTDKQVVDLWMGSAGHRRNILDPDFIDLGVGVGYGTINNRSGWAAVQLFGKAY